MILGLGKGWEQLRFYWPLKCRLFHRWLDVHVCIYTHTFTYLHIHEKISTSRISSWAYEVTFRSFWQQNLQVLGSSMLSSPFACVGPLKEAAADFFFASKNPGAGVFVGRKCLETKWKWIGRVRMGSTSTSKKPLWKPRSGNGWVEGKFLLRGKAATNGIGNL